MSIFKLTTTKKATVEITVTEEQASTFVENEVKKLQDKLNSLKAMDFPETGQAAANSLKAKLNKLEADSKLESSYAYEDIKKRASGASFSGFLTDNGIGRGLRGSATRALSLGKAALEGLKLAGITDAATMKAVAKNAIGGKDSAWQPLVLEWLLDGVDTDTDTDTDDD